MSARYADVFDLLDGAEPILRGPLVQLFTFSDGGRPEANATGFVVSYRESNYLVSADHSFDPIRCGRSMFVYSGTYQEISGKLDFSRITDPQNGTTNLDVGVMRLDPSIKLDCFPIEHSNCLIQTPLAAGKILVITGFPATQTKINVQKKTVRAKLWINAGPSIPPNQYNALGIDARHQLAVYYNVKKLLDRTDAIRVGPMPQGMSGSPIWCLIARGKNEVDFGIAGIATSYKRQDGVFVGTTIAAALGLIDHLSNNN